MPYDLMSCYCQQNERGKKQVRKRETSMHSDYYSEKARYCVHLWAWRGESVETTRTWETTKTYFSLSPAFSLYTVLFYSWFWYVNRLLVANIEVEKFSKNPICRSFMNFIELNNCSLLLLSLFLLVSGVRTFITRFIYLH